MLKGAPLKIVFEPGSLGIDITASGLVTHVFGGEQALRLGVCTGMRAIFVDGQPYANDALDAAIASNIRYEMIFAWQEDTMDSHVLWSSSSKQAMHIIRQHPSVRLEKQSNTSSSSQPSPALHSEENSLNSEVDGPQSDLEQAIPTERKHGVYGGADHLTREQLTARSAYGGANSEAGKRKPVQHMWWYDKDEDQTSSLFSSSAGDGPGYITGDECKGKGKGEAANKKKASKEKTGAQTVAQGSHGAKADSRILEKHLQAVAHPLGSASGSVCQQERAEKPRKQKKPEEYNGRETVIIDIVESILHSRGPDKSDSDEEVQQQKQQGKADLDLSHFSSMSHDELISVVPRCENGRPTSIGSMLHATQSCKVCAFSTASCNCKHGIYCLYCHLPHNDSFHWHINNSRSRNARRMFVRSRGRLRKKVDSLCLQVESDLSLDLDTFELPSSLIHWTDVVKTRLRNYQHGLRMQQPKIILSL